MNESREHTLIIWSSALPHAERILEDVSRTFLILRVFRVHWSEAFFRDNLKVFYSHSQRHLSSSAYDRLLEGKMRHCGTGDFLLVVLEDPTPEYGMRETSSGPRRVNARLFDKKQEYRRWTGGGHRIHTSDTPYETDKDLTLLLGVDAAGFRSRYPGSSREEVLLRRDCTGVGGYDSLETFFQVLDHAIDYCVLRNYECLPGQYTEEEHGDIDLLVEDPAFAAYLTLARPVFPEPWRVYHLVRIGGRDVPFDFRYVGDQYYDTPWEKQILRTRERCRGLFYVPDAENAFYTLLYHAYVQKRTVAPDYLPKLEAQGRRIGVEFRPGPDDAVRLLDGFMERNDYEYTRPVDKSVVYEDAFLQRSVRAFRLGTFVKRTEEDGANGYRYKTVVYRGEDRFVKRGTAWLLGNEYRMLSAMEGCPGFPQVISFREHGEEAVLEMTRLEGMKASVFFRSRDHHTPPIVKSFIRQGLAILDQLDRRAVCHRDVHPDNLIVCELPDGTCGVGLVDFGWACKAETLPDAPVPRNLNLIYRSPKDDSDRYSFGKILSLLWPDLPAVRKVAEDLCGGRKTRLGWLTPYDVFRLFVRRSTWVRKVKYRMDRRLRYPA